MTDDQPPPGEKDLEDLARKLEEWANNLPEEEQLLLQLMLARAEGVRPSDIDVEGIEIESVGEAAQRALRPLVGGSEIRFNRMKRPQAWVRTGNPWLQAAPS